METIKETMQELAADIYPGVPTFWVTVAEDDPGMRMKTGDQVVCARTKARPGDVAVVEDGGKIGFKSYDPVDGIFQSVVVAVVRELGRQ